MEKAVFLDRDGVLNQTKLNLGKPVAPLLFDEFFLVDDASSAVSKLSEAGFQIVIVTNQPEISRGRLSWQVLEKMHGKIRADLNINHIYVCPHDDNDFCNCRKPKPGLLIQASQDLGIDLSTSYLVGDRWRDVEAGQRAGCKCIHIDKNYLEDKPKGHFFSVTSLLEAANSIISS